MKLVTFTQDHFPPRPGVVDAGSVRALEEFPDTLAAVAAGVSGVRNSRKGNPVPLEKVKLLAPIPRPPKVICIGLNYRDHAIESNMPIPTIPVVFNKFSNTVIAPGENVVIPSNTEKPDFEAELAFATSRRKTR
jgi:2-keto-4-pentenoate hydratase/2-oxohepta-3-ene-1,7-dioic acid hydratase in catechol pathway